MNNVQLLGRLAREPEARYTQSGLLVARYTLAVDRPKRQDGTQEADFISCQAFGKTAEFVQKYLHKGTKIAIIGQIRTGSYEKDGVRHYTTDVVVNSHYFCESRSAATAPTPQPAPVPAPEPSYQQTSMDGFIPVDPGQYSDDVPF